MSFDTLNQPDFEAKLAAEWAPEQWAGLTLLVAVSGGADSVALFRGLVRLNETGRNNIQVAHLNHLTRGKDSDGDAAFVESLCSDLGVDCHVGGVDVAQLARQSSEGMEESARRARYEYLQLTAEQLGARYVVTAHTADDQVETILHRIVRGTGLAGLAGMPRARPLGPAVSLIRPMLAIRRSEVIEYLGELEQSYREDVTNRDLSFTRNRIRHTLLPTLASELNPNVDEALLRLGCLAAEAQRLIDSEAALLLERCVEPAPSGGILLRCEPLRDAVPYLVREMLIYLWSERGWPQQSMGFQQWEQLSAMAVADGDSKKMFPAGVTVEKKGGQLTLTRSS